MPQLERLADFEKDRGRWAATPRFRYVLHKELNAKLATIEEEFEALAVKELDPNLPEYERVLEEMDAELTLLVESDPEKLTEEQKLERELLQIINTLLERKFGQLRAG